MCNSPGTRVAGVNMHTLLTKKIKAQRTIRFSTIQIFLSSTNG